MMMVAGMLSRKGRRWGNRDDDDGKDEVVEVDDNNETVVAAGVVAGKRAGSRSPQDGWQGRWLRLDG